MKTPYQKKAQVYGLNSFLYALAISIVLIIGVIGISKDFQAKSQSAFYRFSTIQSSKIAETVKNLIASDRRYAIDKALFLTGSFGGYSGYKDFVNTGNCLDPSCGDNHPTGYPYCLDDEPYAFLCDSKGCPDGFTSIPDPCSPQAAVCDISNGDCVQSTGTHVAYAGGGNCFDAIDFGKCTDGTTNVTPVGGTVTGECNVRDRGAFAPGTNAREYIIDVSDTRIALDCYPAIIDDSDATPDKDTKSCRIKDSVGIEYLGEKKAAYWRDDPVGITCIPDEASSVETAEELVEFFPIPHRLTTALSGISGLPVRLNYFVDIVSTTPETITVDWFPVTIGGDKLTLRQPDAENPVVEYSFDTFIHARHKTDFFNLAKESINFVNKTEMENFLKSPRSPIPVIVDEDFIIARGGGPFYTQESNCTTTNTTGDLCADADPNTPEYDPTYCGYNQTYNGKKYCTQDHSDMPRPFRALVNYSFNIIAQQLDDHLIAGEENNTPYCVTKILTDHPNFVEDVSRFYPSDCTIYATRDPLTERLIRNTTLGTATPKNGFSGGCANLNDLDSNATKCILEITIANMNKQFNLSRGPSDVVNQTAENLRRYEFYSFNLTFHGTGSGTAAEVTANAPVFYDNRTYNETAGTSTNCGSATADCENATNSPVYHNYCPGDIKIYGFADIIPQCINGEGDITDIMMNITARHMEAEFSTCRSIYELKSTITGDCWPPSHIPSNTTRLSLNGTTPNGTVDTYILNSSNLLCSSSVGRLFEKVYLSWTNDSVFQGDNSSNNEIYKKIWACADYNNTTKSSPPLFTNTSVPMCASGGLERAGATCTSDANCSASGAPTNYCDKLICSKVEGLDFGSCTQCGNRTAPCCPPYDGTTLGGWCKQYNATDFIYECYVNPFDWTQGVCECGDDDRVACPGGDPLTECNGNITLARDDRVDVNTPTQNDCGICGHLGTDPDAETAGVDEMCCINTTLGGPSPNECSTQYAICNTTNLPPSQGTCEHCGDLGEFACDDDGEISDADHPNEYDGSKGPTTDDGCYPVPSGEIPHPAKLWKNSTTGICDLCGTNNLHACDNEYSGGQGPTTDDGCWDIPDPDQEKLWNNPSTGNCELCGTHSNHPCDNEYKDAGATGTNGCREDPYGTDTMLTNYLGVTCQDCGTQNKFACDNEYQWGNISNGCVSNALELVEDDGLCVQCGQDNNPACTTKYLENGGCDYGKKLNPADSNCYTCGQDGGGCCNYVPLISDSTTTTPLYPCGPPWLDTLACDDKDFSPPLCESCGYETTGTNSPTRFNIACDRTYCGIYDPDVNNTACTNMIGDWNGCKSGHINWNGECYLCGIDGRRVCDNEFSSTDGCQVGTLIRDTGDFCDECGDDVGQPLCKYGTIGAPNTINQEGCNRNKGYSGDYDDASYTGAVLIMDFNTPGDRLKDSSTSPITTASTNIPINELSSLPKSLYERGALFDGINDYIMLGTHSKLQVSQTTYEVWIKRDNAAVPTTERIIWGASWGSEGNSYGAEISMVTTGKIYVDAGNGVGAAPYLISSMALNDGKWHHIVMTYDSSVLKLYIDGVLDGTNTSQAGSITYLSGCKEFVIGALNSACGTSSFDYEFQGAIDEVRIYDHAFTASDVADKYLTGSCLLMQCGGTGEEPCATGCDLFTDPILGVCTTCGVNQGACCDGASNSGTETLCQNNANYQCDSGQCNPCGGNNQICCAGSTCDTSSLGCASDNKCHTANYWCAGVSCDSGDDWCDGGDTYNSYCTFTGGCYDPSTSTPSCKYEYKPGGWSSSCPELDCSSSCGPNAALCDTVYDVTYPTWP